MPPDYSFQVEKSFLSVNSTGFHRVYYSDWGAEGAPIVLCVHVLTGNGHDFDDLAASLVEDGYRVIAVDMPGRGRSDDLQNMDDYSFPQYMHDLTALLAHLGVTKPNSVDWIGASMGGLLGIVAAALPHTPVKRLVINDAGPRIPQASLDFIQSYITIEHKFKTIEEAEEALIKIRGPSWGPITDEQWSRMAEHNVRPLADGMLAFAYDAKIAQAFKTIKSEDFDLWPYWDQISVPTLVLRGENSTLLPEDMALDMMKRGPGKDDKATLEIIKGCGHVPSLMADDQINLVKGWLAD